MGGDKKDPGRALPRAEERVKTGIIMIRNLIAISIALSTLCGQGFAGGYTDAAPEVVPVDPLPEAISRFEGAYIGGSLGYSFPGDDRVGVSGPGIAGTDDIGELDLGGMSVGLQAGYRWDLQPAILGVELAGQAGNISADFDNSDGEGENNQDYAISLRGSLGWQNRTDTLFYGFAGASMGKFDYKVERDAGGDIDDSFTRTGYLGGVGVERALGARWSLRGEYQYTNYGKETLSDSNGFETEATPDYHSISLGMNYALPR